MEEEKRTRKKVKKKRKKTYEQPLVRVDAARLRLLQIGPADERNLVRVRHADQSRAHGALVLLESEARNGLEQLALVGRKNLRIESL